MSNLLNTLKLIKIVGSEDNEKFHNCFKISVDPMSEISKFTDTEQGINHVIMAMNEGFICYINTVKPIKHFLVWT